MVLVIAIVLRKTFQLADIDQILMHFQIPNTKNAGNFVKHGIMSFISIFLFVTILLVLLNYVLKNLEFELKLKKYKIKKISMTDMFANIIKNKSLIMFLVFVLFMIIRFDLNNYIKYNLIDSNFYEENYIHPDTVNINFPHKKKNLIYIYVESLEATDLSINNAGIRDISLIPELEQLLIENISFSNTGLQGGMYNIAGASYTAGAIIAQSSGISLKLHSNQFYENKSSVLNGISTLGTILESNGYKNYFMMGSNKEFAGRDIYLEQHGNYDVFDFTTAIDLGYIPEDYDIGWWGFEDKKLYEYAQIKLLEISKNKEPFNFSMLTVDTHPHDGYLDETCEVDNNLTQFQNAFACASKMLAEFVTWIKKQDFYKDTVIIITGDHLNMVIENMYDGIDDNYERTVYNAIINSSVESLCYKNRYFSALDMFPTTLAAMGVKIEGERLGLGVNLFSCKETLIEKHGVKSFNEILNYKSNYYNQCLYLGKC